MIGASSAWRRKQQRARRERHQSEEEELAAGAAAAAARGTAMETITNNTTTTEADDARARAGRSSSGGIKGVYEAEAVVTKSKGLRGLLGWGKRTPPAAAASSSSIAASTGPLHPSVQSTVQCTPPGSLRGGVSSGSGGSSSGELHRLGGGGEFGEEEELTRLGIPSPAPSPRANTANAAKAAAVAEAMMAAEAMTEGDDLVLDGHHAHVTGLSREEEAFWSYASPGVDALGYLAEDGPVRICVFVWIGSGRFVVG